MDVREALYTTRAMRRVTSEPIPMDAQARILDAAPGGSSIYPAMWSAQLAARAEGIGSSLTQALAFYNDESLEILGVPKDAGWYMAGALSLGYPTGRWGVAVRQPAREASFRNHWGEPVGFVDDGPLWPDA